MKQGSHKIQYINNEELSMYFNRQSVFNDYNNVVFVGHAHGNEEYNCAFSGANSIVFTSHVYPDNLRTKFEAMSN